jgi:hypothetical protein
MGELARVAALIDDKLPKKLELGEPVETGAEAQPKPAKRERRRRGRR